MRVRHVELEREVERHRAVQHVAAPADRIQRIEAVVRAAAPEIGNPRPARRTVVEVLRVPQRIPGAQLLAAAAHLVPRGIEFVETAAVDGRREPETIVDRTDDAAQIPAPADARQADAGRVNLRAGAHERVAAHDRRDRMVRPLVPDGFSDLRNGTAPAGRSRPFMTRMRLAVALALRDGAARVHRDRGVPAVVPRLHPLGEGRAAAAVHEHHGRHLAVRTRAFGKAPPREDARRLALQRLAFDEDRLHALNASVIVRARNRHGEGARRQVEGLDVP